MTENILNVLDEGIRTERLTLRKLSIDDVQDMFEYTSSPVTCRFLKWGPHKIIDEARQFIEGVLLKYREPSDVLWGIEEINIKKLIGVVRVYGIHDGQAMVSYILNERYMGKGYMTEAVRAVIDICFEKLNLNCILADYAEGNQLSQRVMERCGMKPADKLPESAVIKGKETTLYQYEICRQGVK